VLAVTGDQLVSLELSGTHASEPVPLLAGVAPRCLAVDPHDPDHIYLGTLEGGVYATADGGRSWHAENLLLHDRRVLSIAVSPSDRHHGAGVVYAGTEPSNLYRSPDGGRSWELLPALRELPSEPSWSFPPRPWTHHVRTIALHHTDPGWIAVGIELGGVMRTADRGASWVDHNPQAHSDAHQLLTHPLAPDRVYEAAGQGIARSEDRGATWARPEDGLDRHYAWAQAIDPADPDLWYVAVSRSPFTAHGNSDGHAHLYRSHGNGWAAIDSWGDTPELRRMPYTLTTIPDQPGYLLVGLRGGTLLHTADAGETWTQLTPQLDDVILLHAAPA
jgi:photosystem II stability/assembly factor-like uncharacterized protein